MQTLECLKDDKILVKKITILKNSQLSVIQ